MSEDEKTRRGRPRPPREPAEDEGEEQLLSGSGDLRYEGPISFDEDDEDEYRDEGGGGKVFLTATLIGAAVILLVGVALWLRRDGSDQGTNFARAHVEKPSETVVPPAAKPVTDTATPALPPGVASPLASASRMPGGEAEPAPPARDLDAVKPVGSNVFPESPAAAGNPANSIASTAPAARTGHEGSPLPAASRPGEPGNPSDMAAIPSGLPSDVEEVGSAEPASAAPAHVAAHRTEPAKAHAVVAAPRHPEPAAEAEETGAGERTVARTAPTAAHLAAPKKDRAAAAHAETATARSAPEPARPVEQPAASASAHRPEPASLHTTRDAAPSTASSGAGSLSVRQLVADGKRRVREAEKGGYSLQLAYACKADSVKSAFSAVKDDALFVVAGGKTKTCYRLMWGTFSSRAEAQQAAAGLPPYFQKHGVQAPFPVALDKLGGS